MIRHVVLYAYRSDVPASIIDKIYCDLGEISTQLPGRLSYTWGRYSSNENRNKGFTHCLVADFADEAARDLFINDPNRQAFSKQQVLPHTIDGVNSIISFDFVWPEH